MNLRDGINLKLRIQYLEGDDFEVTDSLLTSDLEFTVITSSSLMPSSELSLV